MSSQKLPQFKTPYERKCSSVEEKVIDAETLRLVEKSIVIETTYSKGQNIFTIFLRPKKDGGHVFTLNLKRLNESVEKQHFKEETFSSALTLVTKGCYIMHP